ncbi:MAG: thiolase family protein, partial [Aeromicrobium sp.]
MTEDVFIVGAARTPHGRYGGSLRDVRVVELGGIAGRAALEGAGVGADAIGEVVVSNCRQAGNGPNPGRQIAFKAGVPEPVPSQTINMACASGIKAVWLAASSIRLGESDTTLAIAAESMSTMPYLAPSSLRWGGVRRGDITIADGWKDGGTDPICGMNMGQTAEKVAREFGIEREAQDAWSARSHQRLAAAWENGVLDGQVVAVDHPDGQLDRDETFRTDSTPEKLAGLRAS